MTMLENIGYITELTMALLPRSHELDPSDEGETVPTFSGWCIVQNFRNLTHPSLANSEGQFHAQDKLEEGESQF